jgi:hypothetical protein
MAATGQCPDPPDHDASIAVRAPRPAHPPAHITLVDGVITRGASFIGSVPHLYAAYPNSTVHGFAVVRTSSTGAVSERHAPIQGPITSRAGHVRRQPSRLADTMGR